MFGGVSVRRFFKDLMNEIKNDNVSNGAAALAYYLMLSIFPAMIFLLTLLPYLPVPNLDQAIMDFIRQLLPGEAATLLTGVVGEIMSQRRGGLLSFGLLLTLWAASNGLYAIMQQLNITYDIKEGRPFWKVRGTALLLMLIFVVLMSAAFGLIITGGLLQQYVANVIGASPALLFVFALLRWALIVALLLLAFSLTYYFGPDVDQKFRFISPGSIFGGVVLIVASMAFRFYVTNFGNYAASYGSLGAVIILMLWLYIAGWVLLLGSEVNSLVEAYSPSGKMKGQKVPPQRQQAPMPEPV